MVVPVVRVEPAGRAVTVGMVDRVEQAASVVVKAALAVATVASEVATAASEPEVATAAVTVAWEAATAAPEVLRKIVRECSKLQPGSWPSEAAVSAYFYFSYIFLSCCLCLVAVNVFRHPASCFKFRDRIFDHFTGFAGAFLDPANQFILLAVGILEIVVSELRPFLFQLALGDVPVALYFECCHNGWSYFCLFLSAVNRRQK